ncbi:hypothetical protein SAMN04488118_102348 [Epibacterium ulvae]|uniref:Uncharacterized protein n=2 Tax=Epibacterium ulvae TaxID=1156985 RepID=A0A1G5PZ44_9RHOB|nr:hypothetical protein [Epibacterium ulvae]SCZ54865.1 hypothetical protein SAMN04488118_102348 [Epibacterium ulvae]
MERVIRMSEALIEEIEEMHVLLRQQDGVRGDLPRALAASRRRLPRDIYQKGLLVAQALPLLKHPKLRMLQDEEMLRAAVQDVSRHLSEINVSERRKGLVLDVLGATVFALLVVVCAMFFVLRWRGFL